MYQPFAREAAEFDLQGLEALVGARPLASLRRLAWRLHRTFHRGIGRTTVWHVNSCGVGGGVADILNSLVPFSTQIGVPTEWLVIGGDDRFFQITKAFHNALQGDLRVDITEEMLAHYERVIELNARMLDDVIARQTWRSPDVIVLHDPQPAGLISHWRARFPNTLFVWRGHIHFDFATQSPSHAGRRVWEYLARYVNKCDAAVFHLPEQVPSGLTIPVRCLLPSINPSGYLNRDLTAPAGNRFIHGTLKKYGMEKLQDGNVPLVAQIARFDPWKDPLGVIQAFREAREQFTGNGGAPHLLLTGPLANDDPEAFKVLAQLGEAINGDGTVHILAMSADGHGPTSEQAKALGALGIDLQLLRPEDLLDLEINAFQTRADVIIAKSIREGFGLAVTGAGYHAKPRIVSQTGGLPVQVIENGRAYACLVGGSPNFSREASIQMTRDWLVKLLSSPRLARALGGGAKRHVIRSFLPHRHLKDYFTLFLALRSGVPRCSRPMEPNGSRAGKQNFQGSRSVGGGDSSRGREATAPNRQLPHPTNRNNLVPP